LLAHAVIRTGSEIAATNVFRLSFILLTPFLENVVSIGNKTVFLSAYGYGFVCF
jgi:hypothetical protein